MPSPLQQRLSGKCGFHAYLIVTRYPSPTLWDGIREDPMGKRDCYPHLVEMSTHLTALHSVEGGHIQREVRTCLSLPSRVVSVEAWWGEKFYFNQAVVTRHHFPSTPIPVPPHVNKD